MPVTLYTRKLGPHVKLFAGIVPGHLRSKLCSHKQHITNTSQTQPSPATCTSNTAHANTAYHSNLEETLVVVPVYHPGANRHQFWGML